MNLESLVPVMARLLGYGPDEQELVRRAIENRLRDSKAMIYGGDLTDGTKVPGVQATFDLLGNVLAEVQALRADVRGLCGRVETVETVATPVSTPAEVATPPARNRKGGGKR